jgi:pimeloyl-ACP methyl ester carboxylesterase
LAAIGPLALQGCQDAARPLTPTPTMSVATAEPAPLVPRIIAPQATDPEIDWIPGVNPQFNQHYVWLDATQRSNPKLFVFLPGSGAKPRGYQLIQQEAARLGYHVIGLVYENEMSIAASCNPTGDPECAGNIRLENIDGIDRSPFVATNRANSIENRLTKLLLYLDAQYPAEAWSLFLKNGEPKWTQIALGGHSLGAGQAAMIGTLHPVDRVVMIAGPAPEAGYAWTTIGKTPIEKYFELVHLRDHFGEAIMANVDALGLDLFGPAVTPELSSPPYSGSHILVTDLEPVGGYATPFPHRSTALDSSVPRDGESVPLLRDAWRYLLGETPIAGP